MASLIKFQIFTAELLTVLGTPQGLVGRDMRKRGERVRQAAVRQAGKHTPVPFERRSRKPGTLKKSIKLRLVKVKGTIAADIYTNDPIAGIHHEGTPPHKIVPKTAAHLVFYWPKVGKVVYLRSVNHPGTKPNRFLTDNLRFARD